MKKKTLSVLLILAVLVGSFITFFSINLFMSDLGNMFYGVHDAYIVGSFPIFFITLDFVMLIMMLARLLIHPERKKSILRLYTIFGLVNSALGLVTSILSGTIIYHSFFSKAIFPCHNLIMTIVHASLIILLIAALFRIHDLENGEKAHRSFLKSILYGLYSAACVGFLLFAMNKFGAVLWSPDYLYFRAFYMLWPLLISLCCLMAIAVYVFLHRMNLFKSKTQRLITLLVIFGVSLASAGAVAIIGKNNTLFVSSASPVLPIERLGGAAYNTIAQPIVEGVVCLAFIICDVVDMIKAKKAK